MTTSDAPPSALATHTSTEGCTHTPRRDCKGRRARGGGWGGLRRAWPGDHPIHPHAPPAGPTRRFRDVQRKLGPRPPGAAGDEAGVQGVICARRQAHVRVQPCRAAGVLAGGMGWGWGGGTEACGVGWGTRRKAVGWGGAGVRVGSVGAWVGHGRGGAAPARSPPRPPARPSTPVKSPALSPCGWHGRVWRWDAPGGQRRSAVGARAARPTPLGQPRGEGGGWGMGGGPPKGRRASRGTAWGTRAAILCQSRAGRACTPNATPPIAPCCRDGGGGQAGG